jgi:hypothetical protein
MYDDQESKWADCNYGYQSDWDIISQEKYAELGGADDARNDK